MANLIQWKGLGELHRFRKEMDDLFDRFFDWRSGFRTMARGRWTPSVDMSETGDEMIVRFEIPGVDGKNIHVSLSGRLLRITGEKKCPYDEKEEHFHIVENGFGRFSRSIELPADVEENSVKATCERGILTLNLAKKKKLSPQKIDIQED